MANDPIFHPRSGYHPDHWSIGSYGTPPTKPEPALTIRNVYDLIGKAAYADPLSAKLLDDIVIWVTGIFEGEYPEKEGEQVITISYVWNTSFSRGAIQTARRIDDEGGDALEWVNFRANADGHNWLDVWGISMMAAS